MTASSPITILQSYTQIREEWDDAWVDEAYLIPASALASCAPTIPTAEFRWHYGKILTGPYPANRERAPETLRGQYVRIVYDHPTNGVTPIWYGRIAADVDVMGKPATVPAGDQTIQARGLEWVLDRTAVDGSAMYAPGGTFAVPTQFPFNQEGPDGQLIGNRSTSKIAHSDGVRSAYTFSATDGGLWTARDVLEYLLTWYGPADWFIQLDGGSDLDALVSTWPAPPTVRAGLNMILDPRRGYTYRLYTDPATNVVKCQVRAVFIDDITVGTASLNGNTATMTLTQAAPEAVAVRSSLDHVVDVVAVRGAPLVVCGTLNFGSDTEALAPAWSGDQATAYDAADNTGRSAEKYRHVYSAFRATSGLPPGPVCGVTGAVSWESTADPFGPAQQFLRTLPLLATDDDEDAPIQYREPFVAAEVGGNLHILDRMAESISGAPSISLRLLSDERGVRIDARPNHLIASGHFAGALGSQERGPILDYEDCYATLAWTSTQCLRVVVDVPGAAGLGRSLILEDPTAQCHVVLDGTLLDVVAGSGVFQDGDDVLRTDVARINAIAAMAAAWYGRTRRAVEVGYDELVYDYAPGYLVTALTHPTDSEQDVEVNSLLTAVRWDFYAATTRLETDFAELDFVGLARMASKQQKSSLSLPGMGAAPMHLPLRQAEPTAGLAGGQMLACLVWQDGGTTDGDLTHECDRTYTARTLDATAIDTGGVLLGEDLPPLKRRWVTNHYGKYDCPPATGTGVVGTGYFTAAGAFVLFDANEVEHTGACT